MNVPSEEELLRIFRSFAGCVLLSTFRKCAGQPYSRTPYSLFHTDRPSSAEHDIASADKETPAHFHSPQCRARCAKNCSCPTPLRYSAGLRLRRDSPLYVSRGRTKQKFPTAIRAVPAPSTFSQRLLQPKLSGRHVSHRNSAECRLKA